nr:uncharacterized mitochondrial protein AtMg00810-like [Tanacetum cinerariifolium]
MRPFHCPVTILNTIDPLGKFKGKADEGPQDTNGNAGTQDIVDVRKEVSDQRYIVLPLWSSISSTFKSSDDKATDDKPKDDTGSKTVKEPVNKVDQAYRDKLNRIVSQDKEIPDEFHGGAYILLRTIASIPIETQKPLGKPEEVAAVDVTPKLSHIHVVKRIFRYLKGQPKLGLWYPKDYSFDLEAYSDSDYARANLERKSTTG